MTTINQYIQRYTGIDITKPSEQQNAGDVDATTVREFNPGTEIYSSPKNTEAIYDAVVGIDRKNHCGFDRPVPTKPARISSQDLIKLSSIATSLRQSPGITRERARTLQEISEAAEKYRRLLSGTKNTVFKERAGDGARHTLIRGKEGHIFEMTNSMTLDEIKRFKRKTKMQINAVEIPDSAKKSMGKYITKSSSVKGLLEKPESRGIFQTINT